MTAAFTQAVKEVLLSRGQGMCEVCGLAAPADAHHRAPRGAGGTKDPMLGLPSNGLAACRKCHDMIEADRHTAFERGWLIHRGWLVNRGIRPAEVPVLYQGDWALLTDDGAVFPPPVGRDRCVRCGFHTPTQGHRNGCQEGN